MRQRRRRTIFSAILVATIFASSLQAIPQTSAQEQSRLYDLPAMMIRPSDIPSEPELAAQRSIYGDYTYYAAVAKSINDGELTDFEKRFRRLGLLGYSSQLLSIAFIPADSISYRSQVWQFRDSDGASDFFAQASNYDDEAGAASPTTIGDETTVVSTSYSDDAGDGAWTRIYFRAGDVVAGLEVYDPQDASRLSSKEFYNLARVLLKRIKTIRDDDSVTPALNVLRLRPAEWDLNDGDWSIGYYRKLNRDVVRQHFESADDFASTVDYYDQYNVESEFDLEQGFSEGDQPVKYYVGFWTTSTMSDAEAFYTNYIQPTGPDNPYQYAPIDATVDIGDASDIFAVTFTPEDGPTQTGFNIVFRIGTVAVTIELRGETATIDATERIAGAQARCLARSRPCTPVTFADMLAD